MGFRKKAFLEAIDDINWNYYWKINGLYNENMAIALDEKCHHRLLVPYGINFNNIKDSINLNNVQMMPQGYNCPYLYPYTKQLGESIGLNQTDVSTILEAIDKQNWSLGWGISEKIGKVNTANCFIINIGSEHHFILLPELNTMTSAIFELNERRKSNTKKTHAVISNPVEYVDKRITKAASRKDIHFLGYFLKPPSSISFKKYIEYLHGKLGVETTFEDLKKKLKLRRELIKGMGCVKNSLMRKKIQPLTLSEGSYSASPQEQYQNDPTSPNFTTTCTSPEALLEKEGIERSNNPTDRPRRASRRRTANYKTDSTNGPKSWKVAPTSKDDDLYKMLYNDDGNLRKNISSMLEKEKSGENVTNGPTGSSSQKRIKEQMKKEAKEFEAG